MTHRTTEMTRILAFLLSALLTGCATTQDKATAAAAHDATSTVIGLAAGASEANPLGLVVLPAKLITLAYADSLPTGERETAMTSVTAIWTGAAVNNWCVLAVIASGGAAAPACLVLGFVVALKVWDGSAMEREFWMICARERALLPGLICSYTTPGKSG